MHLQWPIERLLPETLLDILQEREIPGEAKMKQCFWCQAQVKGDNMMLLDDLSIILCWPCYDNKKRAMDLQTWKQKQQVKV